MNVLKLAKRAGFMLLGKAQKHAPEILIGVGIAAGIATVVLAARETVEVQPILEDHAEKLEKAKNDPEPAKNAIPKVYISTAKELVKSYWPALTTGALSIACILGSYGLLHKRNIALVAAYNTVAETLAAYKKREMEKGDLFFKDEEVEVTHVEPDGKTVTEKEKVFKRDPNTYSAYARFFDETNPFWCKDALTNLNTLKYIQATCNDRLQSRGFLFLNEVYQELGFPMTPAGQRVGWMIGKGDGFVDFGIYKGYREANDFVNGRERSILLDFNVCGPIWDYI